MANLIEEISSASKEQSENVDHVNREIRQMEQKVRKNASSTEQSASVGNMMFDEAENLKKSINILAYVINVSSSEKD